MKKRAFYKDIYRTIKHNLSRFIAIVVMTALGTGVFTGFAVGCMDVFDSADDFYDMQKMYDIKIASTLGLTDEDISAIAKLENVSSIFGNISMDVLATLKDGNQKLANVTTLDTTGMNEPYLLEGTLPVKSGQIAVNSKFIHDTGLKIGDVINLAEAPTTEEDGASKTKTTEVSDSEVDFDINMESDSTTPSLNVSNYVITAVILSPLNITNTEGSITAISFSSNSTDYMMYTTKDCIDNDIYSSIYLTIDGTSELDCYSEEYLELVDDMIDTIKGTLQKERQLYRYNSIIEKANSKIEDAERLLTEKMTEADQKLLDAQQEIDEGWASYEEGLQELHENELKLLEGQQALEDAQKSANKMFRTSQKEIDDNLATLKVEEDKLHKEEKAALDKFKAYEKELDIHKDELIIKKSEAELQLRNEVTKLPTASQEIWNSQATQKIWSDMISDGVHAAPYLLALEQGATPTKELTEAYNQAMAKLQADTQTFAIHFATMGSPLTEEQIATFSTLAVTFGTLNYSDKMMEDNAATLAEQKDKALKQISQGYQQLEEGKSKLNSGQKELDLNKTKAQKQFTEKQDDIEDGLHKIEDAKKELSEAAEELTKGQKELDENRTDYENSIISAREKLSDAKQEVAEIQKAKWFVWDRKENDSFSGLDNDISFIQAVTKAFPIIFFLVAILVSLTTMTRMVEEDRALIGTYKSLGYSKYQISMKYILYAVLACIVGGIFGNIIGFILLPKVISIIISSMYVLPTYQLYFYPAYGLLGFGLFVLGIVGSTIMACIEMLHKRPSELMRPKAPKEGSRIFLERVPFIWKRLSFLNKVTCRNLFRYKKRALMTIVGILGCMMLIVLGFGVKDTVGGLMSDQYDKVTVYDAIVVTDNLNQDEMKDLESELHASGMVNDTMLLKIITLTLWSGNNNLDITAMIIPDGADLSSYVNLTDTETNKRMILPSDGIIVTQNAAKQLKLTKGETISLQNEDNVVYDFPISFVTTNNAGNYVYMSESTYQAKFGDYAGTSLLINMLKEPKGEEWLDELSEDDRILTVSSSQDTRNTFGDVKKIINMVVYMLISMSAVLALTVLFTLSNINISERERELATMKVLGFKYREVNSYINKETLILTLLGILLGMPAGYGITYAILANVSIANIAFNVRVSTVAYVIAALLTMVFTLLVNKITNKSLRKINMVEALKSVE
jgi:putative ABC transport system permease protein